MGLYLSYIVTTKQLDVVRHGFDKVIRGALGHVSLAITTYEPGNPEQPMPVTVIRVGFFEPGRVLLEDEIIRGEDYFRTFFHRSLPISLQEGLKLFQSINENLHETQVDPRQKREAKMRNLPASTPGGQQFDTLSYNCKDFVLSMMEKAGIEVSSFKNLFVNLPTWSGKMGPVSWKEGRGKNKDHLVWSSPIHISRRSQYDTFTAEEKENFQWEKSYSDVFLKTEAYLAHLMAEALKELQSAADSPELNENKREKYLRNLLSNPERCRHSKNLHLISKKYVHADKVKELLLVKQVQTKNEDLAEDEEKEEKEQASPSRPLDTLKEKLNSVRAYLEQPEIKNDLAVHRGFFAWLYDFLKINTSGMVFSFFVQSKIEQAEKHPGTKLSKKRCFRV